MKIDIPWLPNIVRLETYYNGDNFDYIQLIKDRYIDLMSDFCNDTTPVIFKGSRVYLDESPLYCDKLRIKNCLNDEFYTCNNCPFDGMFDIFNHICTIEYTKKKVKAKNGSIRLKKEYKKVGDKSIPRTPGEFCIPRVLLSNWIKPIIMNAEDKNYVVIDKDKNIYTIELIHRKYRIHLKQKFNNQGQRYFILTTAYFFTEPKEIIDQENLKFINVALENIKLLQKRNATSGVSTTPCIDL